LNKAVKRNLDRFPEDFMFQLTLQEFKSLRFQFGISKEGRGGRRYAPYVFTEQGVAMLSSVLSSKRAVHVNIEIMRAFVRLRRMLSSNKELVHKLKELERRVARHDAEIQGIFEAIRELMEPPAKPARQIGFPVEEPKVRYARKRSSRGRLAPTTGRISNEGNPEPELRDERRMR
jgi:hypothetical protein